jgi:uncharacterized protein YbbC (DUF1343 family)
MMHTGLDRLLAEEGRLEALRRQRVGILCHPASVTRNLVHIVPALAAQGIAPRMLFGPEHGLSGHAQDMIAVADGAGATPTRSLYGATFSDLIPRAEDLAQIDVLLIDLQDIGSRYYTFVWTAVLALRACSAAGVSVVVLDRPNPLGDAIEGRLHEDRTFCSFVGLEPTPIRHGLTLGDIVAWRAASEHLPPAGPRSKAVYRVTIIECRGDLGEASEWDRPFVMPSPNMPTLETARVYPGACLLEGTNLSEGRGTTRPFCLFGAPWLDADRLAEHARELPGVLARSVTFQPMFHKHAGELCRGLDLHVTDTRAFRPVYAYAALIAHAHRMHPRDFAFRTERYEFVDAIPAIDLLSGSSAFREASHVGDAPERIAERLSRVTERELEVVARARAFRREFAV